MNALLILVFYFSLKCQCRIIPKVTDTLSYSLYTYSNKIDSMCTWELEKLLFTLKQTENGNLVKENKIFLF